MHSLLGNKLLGIGIGLVLVCLGPMSSADDGPLAFKRLVIDDEGPHNPWTKIIGDVDGDGYADIIIGGQEGPFVWCAWPKWNKSVIAEGGYTTVDGQLGDIDRDGDLDIVMGGTLWYENPRPKGDPAGGSWRRAPH